MKSLSNFIGGKFLPPKTGKYLEDLNPATNEVIAQIPESNATDVDAAVKAAQQALSSWSQTPIAKRSEVLLKIASEMEARLQEFAELETNDTGKPISVSSSLDIPRAISNFRFFAEYVTQVQSETFAMENAFNFTQRSPVGVVGLITPWNLPLYLLTWKLAPALMMGNTVVAKPSELTPLTANLLAEIFQKHAPPGIFNLVHGLGSEAGSAIVSHPHIKAISFTGGTTTGKEVAKQAAPHFKKVSLELGGKNSTIVFADSDWKSTVTGVTRSGFLNQGQICLCGSRIFIEKSIYEKFTEALVEEIKTWKQGDPLHPETKMGALVSEAHLSKIHNYVTLGQSENGKILTGGKRANLNGVFYEPTVIAGLSSSSRTATEEIFGPVVTLHPFTSEDEVVSQSNNVNYGLSASVWTSDLKKAKRVAEKLDVGMVWVNTWLMRDLRVPFGGVKDSGVGREGGRWSLEFFSEVKNICVSGITSRGEI